VGPISVSAIGQCGEMPGGRCALPGLRKERPQTDKRSDDGFVGPISVAPSGNAEGLPVKP
ncbi:hypothetical protein, partial [Kosakonia cowanii]|uniref:hypothetical protein n=1 Tax=Kosakonia cowanii TaxID=208223 RepID=UPI00289D55EF